jgi:hypothetical protein
VGTVGLRRNKLPVIFSLLCRHCTYGRYLIPSNFLWMFPKSLLLCFCFVLNKCMQTRILNLISSFAYSDLPFVSSERPFGCVQCVLGVLLCAIKRLCWVIHLNFTASHPLSHPRLFLSLSLYTLQYWYFFVLSSLLTITYSLVFSVQK